MAAYALLIGTKDGRRSLVADGDPREIRVKFKSGDFPEGFDRIEVIDTGIGRSRSKWLKKPDLSGASVSDNPPVKAVDSAADQEDETETEPAKKRGRPRKTE